MTTKSLNHVNITHPAMPDSNEGRQESTYTYSGSEIKRIPKGLPKNTESLCPECLKILPARIFDDGGKVYMEKSCPVHGYFKELYWSDTAMYLRAEQHVFGDGKGIMNPMVSNASVCPEQCGICNMHISHTGLGNIDLTNRCNMTCPICFANATSAGYVYEPDFETILHMLKTYRDMKPVACAGIQFSGGEPTIHPRFLDIVRAAKDMGFPHLQMASNGLKLANLEFAERTREAGLFAVYLQFDGVNEESYVGTRGREGYFEKKLQAIDNCAKVGLRVFLVPTIAKGYNDDQVGPILNFAVENCRKIGGISFQPMAMTGRFDNAQREQMRYTIPDLVHGLADQTGYVTPEDFFPISCTTAFSKFVTALQGEESLSLTCHPHCSMATYLIINRKDPVNSATPLSQIVDLPGIFGAMDKLAARTSRARVKLFTKISAFNSLRSHYNKDKAPKDLTFMKLIDSLNGLIDKKMGAARGESDWMFFMVGAMHFMDVYNYDIARVQRCVIHYSTPDGTLYPFCTYNSGPTFRDRVEKKFSVSLDEYKTGRKE